MTVHNLDIRFIIVIHFRLRKANMFLFWTWWDFECNVRIFGIHIIMRRCAMLVHTYSVTVIFSVHFTGLCRVCFVNFIYHNVCIHVYFIWIRFCSLEEKFFFVKIFSKNYNGYGSTRKGWLLMLMMYDCSKSLTYHGKIIETIIVPCPTIFSAESVQNCF